MFTNETQEKPPVPRRSRSGISGSVGAEQNKVVIQGNQAGALVNLAKTVGKFFGAPQGGSSLSTSETEQRAISYGTFSQGK